MTHKQSYYILTAFFFLHKQRSVSKTFVGKVSRYFPITLNCQPRSLQHMCQSLSKGRLFITACKLYYVLASRKRDAIKTSFNCVRSLIDWWQISQWPSCDQPKVKGQCLNSILYDRIQILNKSKAMNGLLNCIFFFFLYLKCKQVLHVSSNQTLDLLVNVSRRWTDRGKAEETRKTKWQSQCGSVCK